MKYQNGLFIFHRDLRINDNTALLEAVKSCHKVYLCFIFTEDQASSVNSFRSIPAVSFMIESLESLESLIKESNGELSFFYGQNEGVVLDKILNNIKIDCVFFNRDYTPYAISRERMSKEICDNYSVNMMRTADIYLQEPGTILSESSQDVYKKFTPFYEKVIQRSVETPHRSIKIPFGTFPKGMGQQSLLSIRNEILDNNDVNKIVKGGRKEGLKVLNQALKTQDKYNDTRDIFSIGTSRLSAYIKFGIISIREVYHSFEKKYGKHCEFIRQLYWRDFYAHILFAYPESLSGEHFKRLKWTKSKKWFDMWCQGETGFPIVDAGMRELNHTGYMHNRSRMIVATFLTKTLGLSWKLGEAYFAKHLTDYDIASNNGNWQNISSTGIYYQPYFRDMNPWIQSKKFDPDCKYIKKWIPELDGVESKIIHQWYRFYDKDVYVIPMVDYETQKKIVLEKYEE